MTPVNPVKNQIIVQNDSGYRYSIEPFLLADFASLLPGHEVLDIGTGCGIIPLLMIHREPELQITGVEIQDSAVAIAKQNVSNNKMEITITLNEYEIEALTKAANNLITVYNEGGKPNFRSVLEVDQLRKTIDAAVTLQNIKTIKEA